MISSQNERADAAKEWTMYITVSCLFILIVSVICFFAPAYRLQDLLFRMFDAVIVCVLAVNGLYFLQKNKGVAYVSFLLGFINMGLLIVLMIR
ncbi:hypothetical protein [Bacillus haynesii]|uniref:Uncharacterized protein n=1 Tax=Bacillus haynesii TaxID=1925021 RepID=A0AA90EC15_9BACI|nr:hypothetical protein [Bacillus haynesii]EWH21813.1 hypothetical protein M769_0112495 [Bacillus haynesii]MCI4130146.1 hypothetical protein [Bacillus haynesii]MCY7771095.1 hypothetical protein [Bacillus haynesii]MCY7793053.1 hypothetical protein [Bacillus haynesii]MCY7849528.1 hypothetical protein [Bacillus haynesii]